MPVCCLAQVKFLQEAKQWTAKLTAAYVSEQELSVSAHLGICHGADGCGTWLLPQQRQLAKAGSAINARHLLAIHCRPQNKKAGPTV